MKNLLIRRLSKDLPPGENTCDWLLVVDNWFKKNYFNISQGD